MQSQGYLELIQIQVRVGFHVINSIRVLHLCILQWNQSTFVNTVLVN